MVRQIFAAEITFQDSPLLVREKFNDSEKNIKRLLLSFKRRVEEVYIFCNRQRFTVYVVHHNLRPLTEFFHDEHNLKGYVQYYYNSAESVTHLMATASGLLSPVKGETRVLSQINECYKWAGACGCIGMTLDHALRRALQTGKIVRTESGIDKFGVSVVETGIELLYNRLQDVHSMSFLIVGTGVLAQLALDSLTQEGIRNIAITGQDTDHAARLARKYSVNSITLKSLADYFVRADVVIGASREELTREMLPQFKTSGLKNKANRVIIDLGIPPNFDPETVGMLAEEFYNVDDLRRLQASPLESFGGVEIAWRIILKASNDFVLLLQLLEQSPVLSAYLTRQFELKNADWRIKPKKSLRSMLAFKKSDNISATASVKAKIDMLRHLNNHVPDDAADVVKNVRTLKKFRYFISDN